MLFFKTKDLSIINGVRPNTVFRRKHYGHAAFVCCVSRPKSQSYLNSNSGVKTTCTFNNDDGTVNMIDSFVDISDRNENIHFLPISKFLELYELVIGYNVDGEMLTNRMIDSIDTDAK